MEQSEAFKNVDEIIKDLEKKLAICGNNECEEAAEVVKKEIEEHYAKCINALAARKAVLLGEVAVQLHSHRLKVEQRKDKLAAALTVCKKTKEAATLMYPINPNAAENICKEIKNMPELPVVQSRMVAELPHDIFETIQTHGKVEISGRFSVSESVITFVGSTPGLVDGKGLEARISTPWGMCYDPHTDCFYLCESQNIRRITPQGNVSTFTSGSNQNGIKGAAAIVMNHRTKSFYVANYSSHTITEIDSAGRAIIFAGNGQQGNKDGMGVDASFYQPSGMAIDPQSGSLYVCDTYNHVIRKITPQGEVTTFAGSVKGYKDGNGRDSAFNNPWGICFDNGSQSLLVCDYSNSKLRRIYLDGTVSTLCAVPCPANAVVTSKGVILVATYGTCQIYKVTIGITTTFMSLPSNAKIGKQVNVSVIAGSGKNERKDGNPGDCAFILPIGIAVHEPSHCCFVSEYTGHTIRKISFVNDV